MNYRSWLLVPGISEAKLARAASANADAVVVDLQATVPFEAKGEARARAAQWLEVHRPRIVEGRALGRWVRINPLDSRMWRDDLVAVMASAPDGILLPQANGPEAVRQLAAEIYELEQRHQIPNGATRVMPVVGGTAAAAMTLGSYIDAPHARLAGLSWGVADLAAAIGATRSHAGKGGLADSFRFVRAQTLLTAHAIGLLPVETFHADTADIKGLKLAAQGARADGFGGMMALHPAQVPVINAAFTPSEDDVTRARALFEAVDGEPDGEPDRQIDRRLIEVPQLRQAQRILGHDLSQMPAGTPRQSMLRSA